MDHELERFDASLREAAEQLGRLQQTIAERVGGEAADLIAPQTALLHDPLLIGRVAASVRTRRSNVESALVDVVDALSRDFARIPDAYFRERAADVRDVCRRVLSILMEHRITDATIPAGAIVVTDELPPSMTALLELQHVQGLVTERGGATSHAFILARSMNTPAVTAVRDACRLIQPGDQLLVDGLTGLVFVNPDSGILREYDQLEADFKAYHDRLTQALDLPARTLDGTDVCLLANIGKTADAEAALLFKTEGVGLYRTEFQFAIRTELPSEEEQYQIAMKTAVLVSPKEVVFRVLDLGADKTPAYFPLPPARNPSLGERGIRLMLKYADVLCTQLRALLRVSATHPASVLLPMVVGVEDVLAARKVLAEAKRSLRAEGARFDDNIRVGAMIETASAAVMAPELARHVDFFSLGTNDLVQYVLAADRDDPMMAAYYEAHHPAVLRLLRMVVGAADAASKPLSICGEMASNPRYTELLLGLGLRRFSLAPRTIPEVKSTLRSVRLEHANQLAARALAMETAAEVDAALGPLAVARDPLP